jgi:hypothetical protein
MPPVHRVSHQGEIFPTLNLEVGEDGEAPLFQSTESSTTPLTMSFAVEEVEEEEEEEEDADKGGVGAGGMGNQVGPVHNLQTPSTSNRPRVNTVDDHQPPSRNPSSRHEPQVLFRTPDEEVAPPVPAGKGDPYEEPMWPYPNATAAAIRTAKESAEKMCGPRNFGTVEFDNFNKAWFFRVKAERYDVRACSYPAVHIHCLAVSPSHRRTTPSPQLGWHAARVDRFHPLPTQV